MKLFYATVVICCLGFLIQLLCKDEKTRKAICEALGGLFGGLVAWRMGLFEPGSAWFLGDLF